MKKKKKTREKNEADKEIPIESSFHPFKKLHSMND